MTKPKIDITEEAHAAIKSYCKGLGMSVKQVVSVMIMREVSPKKKIHPLLAADTASWSDVWSRPPFWSGRRAG